MEQCGIGHPRTEGRAPSGSGGARHSGRPGQGARRSHRRWSRGKRWSRVARAVRPRRTSRSCVFRDKVGPLCWQGAGGRGLSVPGLEPLAVGGPFRSPVTGRRPKPTHAQRKRKKKGFSPPAAGAAPDSSTQAQSMGGSGHEARERSGRSAFPYYPRKGKPLCGTGAWRVAPLGGARQAGAPFLTIPESRSPF